MFRTLVVVVVCIVMIYVFTYFILSTFNAWKLSGGYKTSLIYDEDPTVCEFIDRASNSLLNACGYIMNPKKGESCTPYNSHNAIDNISKLKTGEFNIQEPKYPNTYQLGNSNYDDVFIGCCDFLISVLNHLKEQRFSDVIAWKMYGTIVCLVEASIMYYKYTNKILTYAGFVGKGTYNWVYEIDDKDEDGNNKILRVSVYRMYYKDSGRVSMNDTLKKAIGSVVHMPKIYYGSYMLNRDKSKFNADGYVDCSWVIMKKYNSLPINYLENLSEENRVKEFKKLYGTAIDIAYSLGSAKLVFNDWKVDNMLYDPETDEYVLGDIDFMDDPENGEEEGIISFSDTCVGYYINILREKGVITARADGVVNHQGLKDECVGHLNSFTFMMICLKIIMLVKFCELNHWEAHLGWLDYCYNKEEHGKEYHNVKIDNFVKLVPIPLSKNDVMHMEPLRISCNNAYIDDLIVKKKQKHQ